MKRSYPVIFLYLSMLAACSPSPKQQATMTATALIATAAAWTKTHTPTATITPIPSITPTPTITPSPTYDFPDVVVLMQAHCRYGPSKAYLHAADLYPGDTGTVRGRFIYSSWLQVRFDKLDYHCWVAPSVVEVTGDISLINYTKPRLPGPSVLYGSPTNVSALRNGDEVAISWDVVSMTEDDDRGYFIEVFVCQDGHYLWWTASFENQYSNSYSVKDQVGCPQPSYGLLYTVEKHGYSDPVTIP